MSFRGRAQYGQNSREKLQYVNNYRNDFGEESLEKWQNYRGQNFRGG